DPSSRGAARPLLVRHEVVSLPSASVLAAIRRESRDRPPPPLALAVLADPVFERSDPRVAVSRAGRAGTPPSSQGFPPAGGAAADTLSRSMNDMGEGT